MNVMYLVRRHIWTSYIVILFEFLLSNHHTNLFVREEPRDIY